MMSWTMRNRIRYLCEICLWQDPVARKEVSRMDTAHLGRQTRVLLVDVVGEDVGLGIKVIDLRHLSVGAFAGVAQRGYEEAVFVESVDGRGRRIGDVFAMSVLDVVGMSAARHPQLRGLGAAVRAEEGFPVLGDAEDEVGTGKGGDESLDVVELGGHQLGSEGGQLESSWRGRVPREAPDLELGVLEEAASDRAALVAGGSDDHDEFLGGGFGHLDRVSGDPAYYPGEACRVPRSV